MHSLYGFGSSGQSFAASFLQIPRRQGFDDTLPTAGRIRSFHPLERAPARKRPDPCGSGLLCQGSGAYLPV